jgi:hypothetical protein
MPEIIEFLIIGLVTGIYGSIVGIGGGFLIVPILLILYHLDVQIAIGTSLFVVFFNMLSATISYSDQKKVNLTAGVLFAIFTIPGAILGAYLTKLFCLELFKVIFSIILAGASLFLAFGKKYQDIRIKPTTSSTYKAGAVISFFVGFISSLFGIGGGIIHVPLLILYLGFPTHTATATSCFIITISAFVGTLSHLFIGHVNVEIAMLLCLGAIPGAQLGSYISKFTSGTWIIRLLSIALFIVALRLFLG